MQVIAREAVVPQPRITRNLELDALREAAAWPSATLQTVLALVGQLLASRCPRTS
jgi:hypothetical protein